MTQIVWALVHEDEGPKGRVYGISFPDFPGVASGGRTVDEAIARGRETLAFHVEGMIEDGEAIPPLRSLEELRADADVSREMKDVRRVCLVEVPFELPGKPVRVNVSIEDRLLDAIDRAAQARGQTRSAFLADSAQEKIKGVAQREVDTTPRGLSDSVRSYESQSFSPLDRASAVLIQNIEHQIRAVQLCMQNQLFIPSLVLIYSGIDFAASLSRPSTQADVHKRDFISWTETYMSCQIRLGVGGEDLYAARCGIVHTYTPDSKLHRNGAARRIMYTWGNQDPNEANLLVRRLGYSEIFLKVEVLFDAFLEGLNQFGIAIEADERLGKLVASRSGKLVGREKKFT